MSLSHRYKYIGPVLEFDRLICPKWEGETVAVSKKKALSNLAYQFKKDTKRVASSKIGLQEKYLKELEAVMEG